MKLNNFMFKEEYAYTFSEVFDDELGLSLFDSGEMCNCLVEIGLITKSNAKAQNKLFFLSFVKHNEHIDSAINDNAIAVFNKVYLRYKLHYALVLDHLMNVEDAQEFMRKVFRVLDYTFDKYDTLLTIYAEQKSHLLDKLQRIREEDKSHSLSGSHSESRDETRNLERGTEIDTESGSKSKSAGSDTPQTINVSQDIGDIAGYFNKYDQAEDEGTSHSEGTDTDTGTIGIETSGENSSSGSEEIDATESYDPTTMMARIEEIQTKYENTMFKWVEEFDRLFIEEGNI